MQHNNNNDDNDDNTLLSLSLDTWDGERSVHYWLSIVLIQGVFQPPLCDLKQCTLVCKSISKLARDYIQRNFWFQQHENLTIGFDSKEDEDNDPNEKRYLWYSPHCFKNVKNASSLPINTTQIYFFPMFDSPFTFPLHLQQVTHIIFGSKFNQRIGCGIKSEIKNLPLTLTHLEFSRYFNNSIDDLPPNLTHLECGWDFNKSVDSLPPKLTHLSFLENFDQPINKLPLSLTHLAFTDFMHSHFSQPLSQLQRNFESNLEYLILSINLIEKYIPSIPPNYIEIGQSEEYDNCIVYKRKQQQ